jgi:hypothetical protein
MICRIRSTEPAAFLILSILSLSTAQMLGDTLYLDTQAASASCAPVTVSTGSAQITCTTTALKGIVPITDTYGDLSTGIFGSSSYVATNNGYGGGASVSSYLQVTYLFAVSGVQNGSAQFDLSVGGTLTPAFTAAGGGGDANAELQYSSLDVTINGVTAPQDGSPLGTGTTNVAITTPIVNGITQLQFSLLTDAEAVCPGAACISDADFLDPTQITSASVYNANGNLVSDASLISQSGFNPNSVNVASTPELSTLVLLGTGFLGLARLVGRRTKSR